MISGAERLDGGVLDIDLRGESVYPAAAALDRRGARYVFLTGYDGLMVPGAYRHVARFEKPVDPARLVSAFVAAGAERPLA
jgi:DNA-binding LytR/AlgR family response regulator